MMVVIDRSAPQARVEPSRKIEEGSIFVVSLQPPMKIVNTSRSIFEEHFPSSRPLKKFLIEHGQPRTFVVLSVLSKHLRVLDLKTDTEIKYKFKTFLECEGRFQYFLDGERISFSYVSKKIAISTK